MAKEKGRTETVRRMTLAKRAVAELEEKKSIFIGNAAPVRSEDEARAFIEEIRHAYGDATHNVYAYLLDGGAIARFSDAGEPHGTAGMPALNVLKMAGATDLCVVVTRYFGGILLGAGGLSGIFPNGKTGGRCGRICGICPLCACGMRLRICRLPEADRIFSKMERRRGGCRICRGGSCAAVCPGGKSG